MDEEREHVQVSMSQSDWQALMSHLDRLNSPLSQVVQAVQHIGARIK